jgi:hypothetical protein
MKTFENLFDDYWVFDDAAGRLCCYGRCLNTDEVRLGVVVLFISVKER